MLNEINLEGLQAYIGIVTKQPEEAVSSYGITAKWMGGVKTEIQTHPQNIGNKEIIKNFKFGIDEPEELLGSNLNPTPQDYLFAGLAGCMMVGFVVGASNKGIKLDSVELKIKGNLDLRGFLNVDNTVPIGFEKIIFDFEIQGNGTQADYDSIISNVQQFSPNYRTIADTVQILAIKI